MSWITILLFSVFVLPVLLVLALIRAAAEELEEPSPGGQVL
jgi:hypothetical protein